MMQSHTMALQLEAAKEDRLAVQGDISYRNTRIEEVGLSFY